MLEASRGSTRRVASNGSSLTLPRIVPVRGTGSAAGNDWIGLRSTGATRLIGVSRIPLFAGLLGLAILLLAFAGMWAREGR